MKRRVTIKVTIALCVYRYVRSNPAPINNFTVVTFNAVDVANGGKHGGKLYPLARSVVRYNVIKNVRNQLVDPDNFDFRPQPNSTYLQHNVGPYGYDRQMTYYWIPGRQLYKASTPVPPDKGVQVKPDRRDTLTWLNGYGASVHHGYVGISKAAVSRATPQFTGVPWVGAEWWQRLLLENKRGT